MLPSMTNVLTIMILTFLGVAFFLLYILHKKVENIQKQLASGKVGTKRKSNKEEKHLQVSENHIDKKSEVYTQTYYSDMKDDEDIEYGDLTRTECMAIRDANHNVESLSASSLDNIIDELSEEEEE